MKRAPGQHASSTVRCQQQPQPEPQPQPINYGNIGLSSAEWQRSAAAAATTEPATSNPQAAGDLAKKQDRRTGWRRLSGKLLAERQQERAAASQRFEEMVKATSDREELKALMAQHTREQARLNHSEIVLVCNQMAKLCEPQRMPWKAWKDVQV